MNVTVFVGPTLPPGEARKILDAVYMPPATQGDIYRAGLQRPTAIGLIDGFFESVPAVWHREILWVMQEGIHVYGSASMGALRAAELYDFGMVGVGKIFEAFHQGDLEDDDEVTVIHSDAATGYLLLSDAMVNIRATLASAEAEQVIDAATRAALERLAKELFYRDRTYAAVLALARKQGLSPQKLDRLEDWLTTGHVDQKAEDAREMLRQIERDMTINPGPKKVTFSFEHTYSWEATKRRTSSSRAEHQQVEARVMVALRRDPHRYRRLRNEAMLRCLALRGLNLDSFAIPAGALLNMADQFCREHNLTSAPDVDAWLAANCMDRNALDRLLAEEGLLRELGQIAESEIEARMLDMLKLNGDFAQLLAELESNHRA